MDVASVAAQPTALYQWHIAHCSKSRLANFAGFLMPLWFGSIPAEYTAVRKAAGLFDCTHMGVMDVAGRDAAKFLNFIATNEIGRLADGVAQYSYILDEVGNVLDDIIVYRQGKERFMVVVNAANKAKIAAYVREKSEAKSEYKVAIRFLDTADAGADAKVDIALQGPVSADVLGCLSGGAKKFAALKSFHFLRADVSGIDVIIARTGYTGAKVGFELFVHPQKTVALWELILEKGRAFGVEPCGLGARDSLRIEAGLPLYGHELDGDYKISPFEAGYGWAVKLEKDFFVGKDAMAKQAAEYAMEIVRLELPGQKGIRPVRQNDGILDNDGRCVGWVTSCAGVGQSQIALAYVMRGVLKESQSVGAYYLARSQGQIQQGKKKRVEKMEMLSADLTGRVVSRFAKF